MVLLSPALCVALCAGATRSSCVGAGGFADGAWVEGGDEVTALVARVVAGRGARGKHAARAAAAFAAASGGAGTRWHWAPARAECALVAPTAERFCAALERRGARTVAFVGDSLTRYLYVSLLAALRATSAAAPRRVCCAPTPPPGGCLLYTSPSPRDATLSRMPSSA